jgi:anion-transporting  ArsA/GET3 family ATPase
VDSTETSGISLLSLAGRRLLVVTGKGGVGKSTLSASLGLALARTGKRVLLLELDPRESLYQLLDVEPSGGSIVQVLPNLYLQNLRPRSVLDAVIREQLGIELLWRRVLASPVYQHFAEGAPGLTELAVLGHVFRLVTGKAEEGTPEIELVVLDAPATGHGLSLLDAPRLVSDVIHDGPFGRMGRQLAEFVADPARCGVVVATLAEEMPVQEAIELISELERRMGRSPELVLVNRLYPERDAATTDRIVEDDPLLALWLRRREVNDREIRRLTETWPGPRLDLPMLPLVPGPALIAALEERIESELAASQ